VDRNVVRKTGIEPERHEEGQNHEEKAENIGPA
jgi:hypothetical protein